MRRAPVKVPETAGAGAPKETAFEECQGQRPAAGRMVARGTDQWVVGRVAEKAVLAFSWDRRKSHQT